MMAKNPVRKTKLGQRNSYAIRNQDLGDSVEALSSDAASISPDLDATPAPTVDKDAAAAERAMSALSQESSPTPGPMTLPAGEGVLAPAVTAESGSEDAHEEVGEWPVAEIPQPQQDDAQAPTEDVETISEQAQEARQPDEEPSAVVEPSEEEVAAEAALEKAGEGSTPAPAGADEAPAPEPIVQPAIEPAGEGSAMSAPAIHPSALTVADGEAVRGLEQYSNPLTGPRSTTVTTGVSFSRTSLDYAKRAFASDKHRIPGGGPTSFARWLQRAVHQHLALSPEEREAALESAPAPDDGGRKISYNVPLPYHLHHELMAELNRAEMEGWQVNKSAFVREAVAVAIGQALVRANVTQFPPLKGKLKHAR